MPDNPIVRALAERARRAGSGALLTWYRPETGARTELSVTTFANWVDKTANLLDTLDVTGLVSAPLLEAHPGHWMGLVWPLAAWQRGCSITPDQNAGAELVIIGPEDPQPHPPAVTIACSLHPLALGLRDLPPGVLDFTGEALAEPDAHYATDVRDGDPAWLQGGTALTHADTGAVTPQPGRVLVRPTTAWETLAAAVIAPLLGGGSAVVVEGPVDDDALARLVAAERVGGPMA
ncbi:MAG TPA: TIGR03089 family protein [Propionicimonas sp.]|uniref:TIGR03089 family protein n=1 Tax=Propionicimonas sp. TaxID=1955623 RepID=UPI002F40F627